MEAFEQSSNLVDISASLRAKNEIRINSILESRPCGVLMRELRENKRLAIGLEDIMADEETFPAIKSDCGVLRMAKVCVFR